MQIIKDSKNYISKSKITLALGNFDGVHAGHKFLLKETVNISKTNGSLSAVYTFDPHPARIVSPFGAPPMIQTLNQRTDKLNNLGIDICIIENFTKNLAALDPHDYFNRIILPLKPLSIVTGYDFTFGRQRLGNNDMLNQMCNINNIHHKIIEPQFINGTLISSTIIRQLISSGLISEANKLLCDDFEIEGIVERGAGKGKELGFPTANLKSKNELSPGPGVYITKTKILDRNYLPSVTFAGPVATFGRYNFVIETHIIDFKEDISLVDQEISIKFYDKLRDVIVFNNKEELKSQISHDIIQTRNYHEKNS